MAVVTVMQRVSGILCIATVTAVLAMQSHDSSACGALPGVSQLHLHT